MKVIGGICMNLTDMKEKNLLKGWAYSNASENLTDHILPCINKECESYWITCDMGEQYILEYDFDSMNELERQIEHFLSEELFQDIQQLLTVSTFKSRQLSTFVNTEETDEQPEDPNFVLPDFVYNF